MKYQQNIPCFSLSMLTVTIHHCFFAHPLKCSCDRPIIGLHCLQCCTCCSDILCAISCLNILLTPANLCMMLQITGQFGITFIQESMNKPYLTMTLAGCTSENMCLLPIDVLDDWERLEEHIYGCIPLFLELNYLPIN